MKKEMKNGKLKYNLEKNRYDIVLDSIDYSIPLHNGIRFEAFVIGSWLPVSIRQKEKGNWILDEIPDAELEGMLVRIQT